MFLHSLLLLCIRSMLHFRDSANAFVFGARHGNECTVNAKRKRCFSRWLFFTVRSRGLYALGASWIFAKCIPKNTTPCVFGCAFAGPLCAGLAIKCTPKFHKGRAGRRTSFSVSPRRALLVATPIFRTHGVEIFNGAGLRMGWRDNVLIKCGVMIVMDRCDDSSS